METQQKLQHQSPLRKSSRSSSPSSTHHSDRPEPTRTDDAWALSLHVVEQVPLKICYPSDEEDKPSRRSSRFTTNKYKTPSPKTSRPKSLPALIAYRLRRSRRPSSFSCSSLALRDGENVGSGEKRRRFPEDKEAMRRVNGKKKKLGSNETILRRSYRLKGGVNGNSTPQLLALPEPGSSSNSAKKCFLSEKCLRSRSVLMHKVEKISTKKNGSDFGILCLGPPIIKHALVKSPEVTKKGPVRSASNKKKKAEKAGYVRSQETECSLIELPENSRRDSIRRSHKDSSESPKLEMLALSEKSAFSSEKCLRSRSVEMQLEKESSEKIVSVLDELFGDYDERDVEKSDWDVPSEKCLRSRKIKKLNVNVDENPEKTTGRIEGRCGSKSKCNEDKTVKSEKKEKSVVCCFVGEPIQEEVAQERWQWRYELKSKKKGKSWKINADEEDEIILNVDCHYAQAKVGNCVLDIGDCVYVKGEGTKKHIGRILEFFKTTQREDYFRVQWFFRAQDTVLKDAASSHDKRRLFYSTLMNDNILDCIISKVNIVKIPPTLCLKSKPIQSAAFYYDAEYCVEYSTFRTLVTESQSFLSDSKYPDDKPITVTPLEALPKIESTKPELALLDLYSGCGGMSTGLCLGAKLSSVNLVTEIKFTINVLKNERLVRVEARRKRSTLSSTS